MKKDDDVGLGGNINVQGPCTDCPEGRHSFSANSTDGIIGRSSGDISLDAANSNKHNSKGFDVTLKSGNGTSSVGGQGGNIRIAAGNGSGGTF